jgi:hypothetical protein
VLQRREVDVTRRLDRALDFRQRDAAVEGVTEASDAMLKELIAAMGNDYDIAQLVLSGLGAFRYKLSSNIIFDAVKRR